MVVAIVVGLALLREIVAPGSPGIGGSCSRPIVQVGVSATLLERIRLQVTMNWYHAIHTGQEQQSSIGPGIGVQWGF